MTLPLTFYLAEARITPLVVINKETGHVVGVAGDFIRNCDDNQKHVQNGRCKAGGDLLKYRPGREETKTRRDAARSLYF